MRHRLRSTVTIPSATIPALLVVSQTLANYDRELEVVRQTQPELLETPEARARIRQMDEAKSAFARRQQAVAELKQVG